MASVNDLNFIFVFIILVFLSNVILSELVGREQHYIGSFVLHFLFKLSLQITAYFMCILCICMWHVFKWTKIWRELGKRCQNSS